MATEVERLLVRLEVTQARFEKQLARANRQANRRARSIETRFERMNKRLSASAGRAAGAIAAAFAGAVTLRGAQRLIDASTRIDNALKVAGLSGQQLSEVYDNLFSSAQRNAAPLEALVELYSRAALVQGELNISTEELLGFTDRVAVALRVSGKSAAESSGALLQLSQALGSGIVRAEEFNSILEGALPIAQATAAGLEEAGGSVAQLRQLVVDGKVSSEAFFRAFEAGAVILEDKVASAELTVSQRFVRLMNVLTDVAGDFDETTGASATFGRGIDRVSDIVEKFGGLLDDVGNSSFAEFIGGIQNSLTWLDELEESLGFVESRLAVIQALAGTFGAFARGELGASVRSLPPGFDESRFGGVLPTRTAGGRTSRLPESPGGPPPDVPGRVKLSDYPLTGGTGGGGRQRRGSASRRANDFEREVAQIKQRTEAIMAETRALTLLNPLVDDYGASVEKARAAVELETAAREAGLTVTPELKAQIDTLAGAYANAGAEAQRLAESQDQVRERAEEMRELGKDVMGGFVKDLVEGKSAADALAGALGKVADRLLDMALDGLFSGGFGGGRRGGLLGGAIIPGILHSGGVAGKDGYGHARAVPASAFAGAPRYHGGGVAGLRPNEVPAILERGEVVLPKGRGAGPATVRLHVMAEEGEMFVPRVRAESEGIAVQVTQAGLTQYDRQLDRTFASRMGNAQRRQG